jgi:hypothetical protein
MGMTRGRDPTHSRTQMKNSNGLDPPHAGPDQSVLKPKINQKINSEGRRTS